MTTESMTVSKFVFKICATSGRVETVYGQLERHHVLETFCQGRVVVKGEVVLC